MTVLAMLRDRVRGFGWEVYVGGESLLVWEECRSRMVSWAERKGSFSRTVYVGMAGRVSQVIFVESIGSEGLNVLWIVTL